MMISIKNLSKYYGPILALHRVSFEVGKGEILGLLGPNGAGKTTTMRIITCYLPPTSGTVRIGDLDILENPLEVKKLIGYLPEFAPPFTQICWSTIISATWLPSGSCPRYGRRRG